MNSESKMIRYLFSELEKNGIDYCILRNVDEILNGTCHDVDFAVDWKKVKELKNILNNKMPELGWQVFVMKENDQGELLSVHLATQSENVVLMHFDAFKSFNWKGIPLVSNERLLSGKKKYENVWVCSEAVELTLKLFSKYLHGGEVREKYRAELMDRISDCRVEVYDLVTEFISEKKTKFILEAVEAGNWALLHESVGAVRDEIKATFFGGNIIKKLQYSIKRYTYLFEKFFAKNGPVVAFEGCDGSGKSTIVNLLPVKMERIYNKEYIAYYHWRPNVVWKKGNSTPTGEKNEACIPHDKKPYNKLISFVKFMIFNLDYTIGYLLGVKKNVGQGKMVVFDRYYYDYFIDRYRYRLDISDRILKSFLWMIPKPDVTIVLVGTPEIIYERKKEIPLDEVTKQIERLKRYSSSFYNAKLISVDRTPDEIADEVCREIISCMIERYRG